jgi:poly-gamma-glutamate capsule biosynthesis protein CapA/YwtB (metallophosphatase superfamily)
MLGRTVGAEIQGGTDPLAGVRPLIAQAPETLVNLECVVSEEGASRLGKTYDFRAPLEAVRVLTGAGISAVSLANNHANDFGTTALLDSISRLKAGDVFPIGAAATTADAYAPHFFSTRAGIRGAIIALDDTDARAPEIATARDLERVAAALAKARSEASFVFAFVHWGDENTSHVTERQRELARWLIDHGADAVAGSHPHRVQGADSYHGRPIVYSLGNLVFDGAPGLPGWNHGQLLEFNLATGRPTFQLVPVELDARGFPSLVETSENQEREKSFATAGAAFSRSRVQGASKNR